VIDARTVLVIDDETDVRFSLEVQLTRAGMEVLQAADGRTGLRQVFDHRPDCVVLDIGLPDLDGWAVLERIRDVSDVPVMLLTARHDESDKVRGLLGGADDYLTKPFGNREFVARVLALLRRATPPSPSTTYSDARLIVDADQHRVVLDGVECELTPIEFRVLQTLATESPRVVQPAQLLESAWGDWTATGPDRVKFVIHRLRQKLGFDSSGPIETVRGVGYRYRPPE